MKKITIAAILMAAFISMKMNAQDDSAIAAEMQKKWMEYMTPGAMHSKMAEQAGTWKASIRFWMFPGAEAQVSEGRAINKMILGGRYLQSINTGTVFGGMEMEGISYQGFDNATKEFTAVWIDNMGTGTMILKGTWDSAAEAINLNGEMVDPMDGVVKKVKEKVTIIDKNHHRMEMWNEIQGGQMFKSMEIDFVRESK